MDVNAVVQTEEPDEEVVIAETAVETEGCSTAEVEQTEACEEEMSVLAVLEGMETVETSEVIDVEAEALEMQVNEMSGAQAESTAESQEECVADESVSEMSACREDGKMDEVMSSLTDLNAKMEEMNRLFIQKIQHTTHEEKIVDQMHAELQKYKEDMYAKLVRPILLDIIEVRDSIQRMAKSYAEKGGDNPTVPLSVFSDYTYDIQDILEKNDITIYQGQAGDAFSPMKQRVLKKVATTEAEMHGKIAESLSCGYEYQGKTISPEKVVVYFYEKPVNTEGENK